MKNSDNWLTACLEEYKTVRTECLTAIKMQNSTLTFGALVVGILAAAAANVWSKDELGLLVAGVIFWVVIPLISLLITLIWAGEVIRLLRAHGFIKSIENRINKYIDETPKALQYERWLDTARDNKIIPRIEWNYWAVIILFVLIAVLSCVGGHFIVKNKVCTAVLYSVPVFLVLAVFVGSYFGIRECIRRNKFLKEMEKDCQQHLTPVFHQNKI